MTPENLQRAREAIIYLQRLTYARRHLDNGEWHALRDRLQVLNDVLTSGLLGLPEEKYIIIVTMQPNRTFRKRGKGSLGRLIARHSLLHASRDAAYAAAQALAEHEDVVSATVEHITTMRMAVFGCGPKRSPTTPPETAPPAPAPPTEAAPAGPSLDVRVRMAAVTRALRSHAPQRLST